MTLHQATATTEPMAVKVEVDSSNLVGPLGTEPSAVVKSERQALPLLMEHLLPRRSKPSQQLALQRNRPLQRNQLPRQQNPNPLLKRI